MPYTIEEITLSGGTRMGDTMRFRVEPLLKQIIQQAAKGEGLGASEASQQRYRLPTVLKRILNDRAVD